MSAWQLIGTAVRPNGEIWGVYKNGVWHKTRPGVYPAPIGIEGGRIGLKSTLDDFDLKDYKESARNIGYLQHGHETAGPFRTESVPIRHTAPDIYHAHYCGRWRIVHVQLRRLFIVYRGQKITIQIEGV